MLRRIRAKDAQLGMFVHQIEGTWFKHAFWKSQFLIADREALENVHDCGADWITIDTDRGKDINPASGGGSSDGSSRGADRRADILRRARQTEMEAIAQSSAARQSAKVQPIVPQAFSNLSTQAVPLAMEMKNAAGVARQSALVMREVFTQARLGRTVKIAAIQPMTDAIMASIRRHPHAFNGMMRLMKGSDHLYAHALTVCALMIGLAIELKMGQDDVRTAGLAGLLMDVGMGHVPQEIYDKPGELTLAERQIVQGHTRLAYDFMAIGAEVPEAVLDVCLHHHERVDGSGYPDALVGDQIGIFARMAAICDVYAAMTARRPYKAGMDPSEALKRLGETTGQFDPQICEAFIRSVGIYPVGSLVRLASKRLAFVVEANPRDHTVPRVCAFYSTDSRRMTAPEILDLARMTGMDSIVGRDTPENWDIQGWEKLVDSLYLKAAGHDAGRAA